MNFITSVFEAIGSVITGFLGVLSNLFSGVMNIFWTTGETGGPTTIGYLLLIGVGTPLVFWGINWIIGLFKRMLKR